MDWIKVTVTLSTYGIDTVSGILMQNGIDGIEISDKEDFKDFLENNRRYWDYVDEELEKLKDADTTISFYLSKNSEGIELLNSIKSQLSQLKNNDNEHILGSLETACENVRDEDWNETWKQFFHQLKIGEKLLICPNWEECDNSESRTVFYIDPGMSFGTGSHPSTRFCLEESEKYIKQGDSVLDLGCGSGILSICAILLGASSAVGVDVDENSIDSVKTNLQINNIDNKKYEIKIGDLTTNSDLRNNLGKFDIVFANIVADVIIAISPFALNFLKPDGIFITSGIINERLNEVKSALISNGFEIINIKSDDDWSEITAKRNGD